MGTTFLAACLSLPFIAGLETGFALTFFGGGSTFWYNNGIKIQTKIRSLTRRQRTSISSCAFVVGAFFDNADGDEVVVNVVPLVSRAELRVARVEEASESGAGSLTRFRFQEYIQQIHQTGEENIILPLGALSPGLCKNKNKNDWPLRGKVRSRLRTLRRDHTRCDV